MRDWLYKARKSKGKSQDDVAKEVKISRQYYGMIENNIKTPTVPVAKKIGKVLDVNWHLFYE
ncbi:helix-turn-helix transcriptional regulator [Cytobacillus praedii]|uniref:helix-turn-helix transcriptional regulator n=1 Tax=Cytobacillus praedii TaxID=1742358 RepID=UPI002E2088F7|nr:helix-turn-helix transcriptional regulator [Cytobacillus praedii]